MSAETIEEKFRKLDVSFAQYVIKFEDSQEFQVILAPVDRGTVMMIVINEDGDFVAAFFVSRHLVRDKDSLIEYLETVIGSKIEYVE